MVDWDRGEDGFAARVEEVLLAKGFSIAASDAILAAVTPLLRDESFRQAGDALGALLLPLRSSKAGVSMLYALNLDLGHASLEEAGKCFGASPQAIEQAAARVRTAFAGLPRGRRKARKRRRILPPDDSGRWLDRSAAATRMRISLATLFRYQREGLLRPVVGRQGGVFFAEKDVDEVFTTLAHKSARQVLKGLRCAAKAQIAK